jgi:hypothetical protein
MKLSRRRKMINYNRPPKREMKYYMKMRCRECTGDEYQRIKTCKVFHCPINKLRNKKGGFTKKELISIIRFGHEFEFESTNLFTREMNKNNTFNSFCDEVRELHKKHRAGEEEKSKEFE